MWHRLWHRLWCRSQLHHPRTTSRTARDQWVTKPNQSLSKLLSQCISTWWVIYVGKRYTHTYIDVLVYLNGIVMWPIQRHIAYMHVCNQPFISVGWIKIPICFTNRIYRSETFEFFCSFETFEFLCSCIRGSSYGRWTRWRISGACRSWVTDRTRNWWRNSHKLKEHDFKKYLKVIGADSSERHSTGYKGGTIYVADLEAKPWAVLVDLSDRLERATSQADFRQAEWLELTEYYI